MVSALKNFTFWGFLFLGFGLLDVLKITLAQTRHSLRILSHNVLAFSGHPGKIHKTDSSFLRRAVDFYRENKIDVLVLQECPDEKDVELLARGLGFHKAFFLSGFEGNEEYPYGFPGAVLSRFPIVSYVDFHAQPATRKDSLFQRHLGTAWIRSPFGLLQVTGLHLCADWGGRIRESTRMKELDIAISFAPPCDSCFATVWAGDFNSRPESRPYQKVLVNGFLDSGQGENQPTVPVPDVTVRIDYIFLKKKTGGPAIRSQIVSLPFFSDRGLYLSDHVPVLAEILPR